MQVYSSSTNTPVEKKRRWLKIVLIVLAVLLVGGCVAAWKTGFILNKISTKGGLVSSLLHNIPGVKDELKGEADGRINILLLGMRGENVPGGGLLADTIMVVSVKPAENKVAITSIPRDLYVTDPGTNSKSKINAVYVYGEEKKGKGGGIEDMKTVISDITGIPIHYGVSINFQGFIDLVDALGGIQLRLDQPFNEPLQFNEPHVCDSQVFTEPTGQYEYKKHTTRSGRVKIVAQYPLCINKDVECGGNFQLPAGDITLDGSKALCYARARYTSNDFERAKRQQVVIQAIKDKALKIGTLADFGKINGILDALGDNVRMDIQLWEIQRLYDIYQKNLTNPQILQHVLENSEEGLLYAPESTPEAGYILLPRGDNYDQVRNLFQNIFTLPSQSDSKPK